MNQEDRERTQDQTTRILEMLTKGPVTNATLSRIALKYTSRISEIRKRGYTVICKRLGDGLTQYSLAGS